MCIRKSKEKRLMLGGGVDLMECVLEKEKRLKFRGGYIFDGNVHSLIIIIVTLINRCIPHENTYKYKLVVLQISRSAKQVIIQFNRTDKAFCVYM